MKWIFVQSHNGQKIFKACYMGRDIFNYTRNESIKGKGAVWSSFYTLAACMIAIENLKAGLK